MDCGLGCSWGGGFVEGGLGEGVRLGPVGWSGDGELHEGLAWVLGVGMSESVRETGRGRAGQPWKVAVWRPEHRAQVAGVFGDLVQA